MTHDEARDAFTEEHDGEDPDAALHRRVRAAWTMYELEAADGR